MSQTAIIFLTIVITIVSLIFILIIFTLIRLWNSYLKILETLENVLGTIDKMQSKPIHFKIHSIPLNVSKPFESEEIDEDGRNKQWYIDELSNLNAKFDSNSSLSELRKLYYLLM